MQILRRSHIEEDKAFLNQSDYHTLQAEDLTIHNVWGHSVGGFKTYIWIIIGTTTILVLTIGLWYLRKLSNKLQESPAKEQDKSP